jgi:hypothetical protein
MHRPQILLCLPLVACFAAPAAPQESSSSSEQVIVVSKATAGDGGSDEKHYKKVVVDGRVVEESGDRSLLDELEIGRLLDGLRLDVDVDARGRAGRRARTGDVPKWLEDGWKGATSSSSSSSSRRVVVENGEVVVDEEYVDGKPVRRDRRDRRGRALPGGLERVFDLDLDLGDSARAGCGCPDCPLGGAGSRLDGLLEELLEEGLPRGAAPRGLRSPRGGEARRPVRLRTIRLDPFQGDGPLFDLERSWDWDTDLELEKLEHLLEMSAAPRGKIV